jgi:hypothetical protein
MCLSELGAPPPHTHALNIISRGVRTCTSVKFVCESITACDLRKDLSTHIPPPPSPPTIKM